MYNPIPKLKETAANQLLAHSNQQMAGMIRSNLMRGIPEYQTLRAYGPQMAAQLEINLRNMGAKDLIRVTCP